MPETDNNAYISEHSWRVFESQAVKHLLPASLLLLYSCSETNLMK